MSEEFRAGVIGVGSMGKNHARVYSEMHVLGGIADSDTATAKPLAERFGVNEYADYRDMLAMDDIDAVNVATPTQTHYRIVMDAINAGKHVLVEKPLCTTVAESEEVVKAAEDAGLVLAVGLIERHNPVVKFARDAIKEDRFGNVVTLSSRRVSSMPGRIRDIGVIMDLGIHDVDVMRYLASSPVTSVYTLGGKRSQTDFEDHANILLNFENGILGLVEVNWLTPMKVRKLALTCLKNYVELDYITQSANVSSSELPETFDTADLYRLPIEFHIRHVSLKKQEPLRNELEDFKKAVLNNGKPLITGPDAIGTLKVCQAALESMKEQKRIILG
jgi:UDP-N-acetylglucosamine 3-dehydrogenase